MESLSQFVPFFNRGELLRRFPPDPFKALEGTLLKKGPPGPPPKTFGAGGVLGETAGAGGAAGRDASRVGKGERGACVGSGRLGAPRSSPPMEMVPRSMVCIICLLNFGSAGHSPHDTRCHMMRRILRVHTPFYVMSGCCDTGWGNLFFTKCKKRLTTACRGVYYSINDML